MAICRNIQNDDLYRYLGNNKFKNLRTGKEGDVDPDMAKKILKINLKATQLIGENIIIEEMINVLNLKFDNNKK